MDHLSPHILPREDLFPPRPAAVSFPFTFAGPISRPRSRVDVIARRFICQPINIVSRMYLRQIRDRPSEYFSKLLHSHRHSAQGLSKKSRLYLLVKAILKNLGNMAATTTFEDSATRSKPRPVCLFISNQFQFPRPHVSGRRAVVGRPNPTRPSLVSACDNDAKWYPQKTLDVAA